MAKIYRRQRHGHDGEDSVSDEDDEGLTDFFFFTFFFLRGKYKRYDHEH